MEESSGGSGVPVPGEITLGKLVGMPVAVLDALAPVGTVAED